MQLHYEDLKLLVPSIITIIGFSISASLRDSESRKKNRDICIACIAVIPAVIGFAKLIAK